MRHAVLIEQTPREFSAYVPDLPGCVATGASTQEVEQRIRDAIAMHVSGLRDRGLPIPMLSSSVE